MTPTIKLLGMLLSLAVLAGCPDWSATATPSWQYTVATYEEPRPLAQTFADLIAFIEKNHPALALGLNPPATEKKLDALEDLIGQRLPDNFRRLYRLANGQKTGATPLFPEGYAFMTLEEVSNEWRALKHSYHSIVAFPPAAPPQGAVKDRWWHPSWIPFAATISGDHYCIDLDPAQGGRRGQVIEFILDDNWRPHLGLSLNDYLGAYEQDLRAGTYVYHDAWDVFTKAEEGGP